MNLLFYRGMQMRIIQSLPHVRTVELDESRATYKWTRWDLSFIVTLEPAALSAALRGGLKFGQGPDTSSTPPFVQNPAFNLNIPPSAPADTDKAIRRFLEYPRGTLIVDAVGLTSNTTSTVLRSPANPSLSCDANNGPFCKVNSIQEVAGEGLWQLHLSFTTYIYEDSLAAGKAAPVLISNRWSVTTDTNAQHLTDRIIDGIVHFRADQLLAAPAAAAIADFYRDVFAAFTVPSGFERQKVLCTTLPQGNMLRYHILDREQPYQQFTKGVFFPTVRLEYVERSWMWRGSVGRGIAGATADIIAALPAFAGAIPFGGAPIFAAAGAATPNAVNRAIGANLPKRYKTVIAKAWGNRLANRALIVQRALQLANARMGQPGLILPFTQEISISYHSAQLMAQVESTIAWSFNDPSGIINPAPVLSLLNLLFPAGTGGLGDLTYEAFAEMGGDALGILQLRPNDIQPPFPSESGTHGTWPRFDPGYLSDLATQTLEGIGQAPDAPP